MTNNRIADSKEGRQEGYGDSPGSLERKRPVSRGATFIRDVVWDLLRDPMSFTLFYLIKRFKYLPWIKKRGGYKRKDLKWLAEKMGVSVRSAYRYLKKLLAVGLVTKVGSTYKVRSDRELVKMAKSLRAAVVTPVSQPCATSVTSRLPQTPLPIAPEAQKPPLVYKDFTSTSYINTHIQAAPPPRTYEATEEKKGTPTALMRLLEDIYTQDGLRLWQRLKEQIQSGSHTKLTESELSLMAPWAMMEKWRDKLGVDPAALMGYLSFCQGHLDGDILKLTPPDLFLYQRIRAYKRQLSFFCQLAGMKLTLLPPQQTKDNG